MRGGDVFSGKWVGALSGPWARDVSQLPAILTSSKTEIRVRGGGGGVGFFFFVGGGSLCFRVVRLAPSGPVSHDESWVSAILSSSKTEILQRSLLGTQQ